MAEVQLNDKDLSSYGAMMLTGSYNSLLSPAPLKEWVANDPINSDGVEYMVPKKPLVAERTVDLIFGITGKDKEDFIDKYNRFLSVIQGGIIKLYVPDIGKNYHLKYEQCTSFDHYHLRSCKLAIKFTEPNPKNND